MSEVKQKKIILFFIVILIAGAASSFFFLFGPPNLLAKSDEPDFCKQCHVMESEYEAWMHAGAHRRKKCVDCHLPNESTGMHYAWKTITGLKDFVFFYSGKVPEEIKLTLHGEKVLQTNCTRCHETAVSLIDAERKCWSCHRRISHRRTGTIETL